jgi:hypothetical protein
VATFLDVYEHDEDFVCCFCGFQNSLFYVFFLDFFVLFSSTSKLI